VISSELKNRRWLIPSSLSFVRLLHRETLNHLPHYKQFNVAIFLLLLFFAGFCIYSLDREISTPRSENRNWGHRLIESWLSGKFSRHNCHIGDSPSLTVDDRDISHSKKFRVRTENIQKCGVDPHGKHFGGHEKSSKRTTIQKQSPFWSASRKSILPIIMPFLQNSRLLFFHFSLIFEMLTYWWTYYPIIICSGSFGRNFREYFHKKLLLHPESVRNPPSLFGMSQEKPPHPNWEGRILIDIVKNLLMFIEIWPLSALYGSNEWLSNCHITCLEFWLRLDFHHSWSNWQTSLTLWLIKTFCMRVNYKFLITSWKSRNLTR
jgi:hypothetical protein